jgi:hypothetical protein
MDRHGTPSAATVSQQALETGETKEYHFIWIEHLRVWNSPDVE